MTIVNNGMDYIKNELIASIDEISVGTNDDATTTDMNSLKSPVITKAPNNLEGTEIGESLHQIRLLTSEANDNILKEVGAFTDDGNMFSRNIHAGIEKDSTFEVLYEISINNKNP